MGHIRALITEGDTLLRSGLFHLHYLRVRFFTFDFGI